MTDRFPTRRWCAAGAATLGLIVASACGPSTPGTAPSRWASTFCGALGRWTGEVKTATTAYQAQMAHDTVASDVKSNTLSFLGKELTLTDTLIATVSKDGDPAVTDGKKVSETLIAAFTRYKSVVVQSENALEPIVPTNTTQLTGTLDSIGSAIDSADVALGNSVAAVGTKYSTSGDQPLVSALDSEPACTAFEHS